MLTARAAWGQSGDINGDGCVDLQDVAVVQRGMTGPQCTPGDAFMEMVLVPGGGAGPEYDFLIGKYEVTNEQFAAFLNDAQADGGQTLRGSAIRIGTNKDVRTITGVLIAQPYYLAYNPEAPVGQRFRAELGYEKKPVFDVAWIASAKFCNWLTVHSGLSEDDACYVEVDDVVGWRPRVISREEWRDRDLNDFERHRLVTECRGYRLPMDAVGMEGAITVDGNPFDEWYKAAAYDPDAPNYERPSTGEVTVKPNALARHWRFGFGRDELTAFNAHCGLGRVGLDGGFSPVGWFDGSNWMYEPIGTTEMSVSHFGLFDVSGNAPEWVQDRMSYSPCFATRGGAYWSGYIGGTSGCEATARLMVCNDVWLGWTGLRVVRVP